MHNYKISYQVECLDNATVYLQSNHIIESFRELTEEELFGTVLNSLPLDKQHNLQILSCVKL